MIFFLRNQELLVSQNLPNSVSSSPGIVILPVQETFSVNNLLFSFAIFFCFISFSHWNPSFFTHLLSLARFIKTTNFYIILKQPR